jgi:dihydroneopterin aldolase
MDTIILRDLFSQADIGLDCWGRLRTQPVLITALVSTDVSQAGLTDKADDLTVDYSALGKSILKRMEEGKFGSLHCLARELAEEVVPSLGGYSGEGLQGDGVEDTTKRGGGQVKIIATAPKQLLCADALRITVIRSTTHTSDVIDIQNLQANLVLGLNPAERLVKQRVLVNISLDVQEMFFQVVDTDAIQLILGRVLDVSLFSSFLR